MCGQQNSDMAPRFPESGAYDYTVSFSWVWARPVKVMDSLVWLGHVSGNVRGFHRYKVRTCISQVAARETEPDGYVCSKRFISMDWLTSCGLGLSTSDIYKIGRHEGQTGNSWAAVLKPCSKLLLPQGNPSSALWPSKQLDQVDTGY